MYLKSTCQCFPVDEDDKMTAANSYHAHTGKENFSLKKSVFSGKLIPLASISLFS